MTLYLDTSALLKLYVEEDESQACETFVHHDRSWFTAGHTLVEVRRNLSRLLDGGDLDDARTQFEHDWADMEVVGLDAELCEAAARAAERTGTRSLDALHVAAALRVAGRHEVPPTEDRQSPSAAGPVVVTYDLGMTRAAEFYGLDVVAPADSA